RQVVVRSLVEASFECAKAVNRVEKTICGDAILANLDRRLSTLYKQVLEGSSEAEQIKTSQRSWLRNIRNGCETAPCLKTAYERRIQVLERLSKKANSRSTN